MIIRRLKMPNGNLDRMHNQIGLISRSDMETSGSSRFVKKKHPFYKVLSTSPLVCRCGLWVYTVWKQICRLRQIKSAENYKLLRTAPNIPSVVDRFKDENC